MKSARSMTHPSNQRRQLLTTLIALAHSLGCAVYDSSLLPHDVSESNGGNASALNNVSAGAAGAAGAAGVASASGGGAVGDRAGGPSAGSSGSAEIGGGGAAGLAGAPSGGSTSGGESGGTAGNLLNPSAGSAGASVMALALGKSAASSAEQGENPAGSANDGNNDTRWCAPTGDFPQWWRVDLGAVHTLAQIAIRFEYPDRNYVYTVESSLDAAVYTQRAAVTGTGTVQTLDFPPGTTARFVRITITGGIPATQNGTATWASMYEVSVTGQ